MTTTSPTPSSLREDYLVSVACCDAAWVQAKATLAEYHEAPGLEPDLLEAAVASQLQFRARREEKLALWFKWNEARHVA